MPRKISNTEIVGSFSVIDGNILAGFVQAPQVIGTLPTSKFYAPCK
jgi:hypothetical protein